MILIFWQQNGKKAKIVDDIESEPAEIDDLLEDDIDDITIDVKDIINPTEITNDDLADLEDKD